MLWKEGWKDDKINCEEADNGVRYPAVYTTRR